MPPRSSMLSGQWASHRRYITRPNACSEEAGESMGDRGAMGSGEDRERPAATGQITRQWRFELHDCSNSYRERDPRTVAFLVLVAAGRFPPSTTRQKRSSLPFCAEKA